MSDTGPEGNASFVSRLLAWTRAPFTQPISLMNFALIVVLGVTIAVFWSRILAHITEE